MSAPINNTQLKIATFNLFNYLEPPNAYYEFERIYSAEQWAKKQHWISTYLQEYQPDIIGFQEVFSPNALKDLVAAQGYLYFEVIDKPTIIDEFIYKHPVVAIASRYPIVELATVTPDVELATNLGLLDDFSFSRNILRATINVPHLGQCDCYVVHFKSKRSMLEINELNNNWSPEQTIIEHLKANIAGSWGSTIQRGSEATLLMIEMIKRRETTRYPMILMGDFNNDLTDGVLNHLLTNTLRFVSAIDRDAYLEKYCLQDSWDLFEAVIVNENQGNQITDVSVNYNMDDGKATNRYDVGDESKAESINKNERKSEKGETLNADFKHPVNSSLLTTFQESTPLKPKLTKRKPTHYFGASSSVLDYILLSCEFDASYHDSLYKVSDYQTYDRHLINPIFDRDGESTDHAIVLVTLSLRS